MLRDDQLIGFTDLHTHILPGVDDGAPDLVIARKLVQMAWHDGTKTIFLTPHFRGVYRNNSVADLQKIFYTFRQEMESEFSGLRLYLGSEIHYQSEVPEWLAEGKLLSLASSQYALLEFSTRSLRSQIISGVYETIRYGYVPIIAHAERYSIFCSDYSLVDELLNMGALIQVNADSVMGKQGFGAKYFCHRLLKAQRVHFIASDAHDEVQRPPLLRECFLRVQKKYGIEYATQIFYSNAQAIMGN